MVVEGIHTVLSLIISWPLRFLAHELDQYSYIQYKILSRIVVYIAIKQTKAGPKSSGTPVLVLFEFDCILIYKIN